ncbi:GyrI-like domain-containing protein [Maribacter sp. 2308TA10-17]|uniref:GyrI-like domain-containing protein n=1 Tax=Maribacter sp. 2308TA10-17 TaxID=3386276 RepID=UPI0039BD580C
METRIEMLPEKQLIGKSIRMSLANNKIGELWRSFQINKSAISNAIGTDLYSIQVYDDASYFENFNPQTEFTKWAATEVKDIENIPNGFSSLVIPEGLYAVFLHKGTVGEFQKTFQHIFTQWLPNSDYEIDNRPHFELLGEKYKNNDPNSEEEVWIPVKKK